MEDLNYRSLANNRAAVTITTSLYDRRALDVTSDKPLVNSLNHLTYLVSSSAKVRETLLTDGGLERLVEILHECHLSASNVRDNIFNGEKKLLTAWKWTLAFQCLVLIGTRGTEKIRQKVVRAGMLPVIATVLDNYINLHEGTFFGAAACAPLALAQFCASADAYPDTAHPHPTAPTNGYTQGQNSVDTHPQIQRAQQIPSSNLLNNLNEEENSENLPRILNPYSSPTATARTNQPGTSEEPQISVHEPLSLGPPNPLRLTSNTGTRKKFDVVSSTVFNGACINTLTSDDYETLSVDQLFRLIRESFGVLTGNNKSCGPVRSSVNNDIRRRCLIMCILKKLREKKATEVVHHSNMDESEYDMDTNLQFLSNLYLQDEKTSHITTAIHSKIAPRNFTETGIIIPRDDDVVWCLQLLAYISKYPYLKEVLQNTHLVLDMSIRDNHLHLQSKETGNSRCSFRNTTSSREALVPRSRTGRFLTSGISTHSTASNNQDTSVSENLMPSASNSLEISNLNIRNDISDLGEDGSSLCHGDEQYSEPRNTRAADLFGHVYNQGRKLKYECDGDVDENGLIVEDDVPEPAQNSSRLKKLFKAIIEVESIPNDLDRELALFRLSDKVNECIEEESRILSTTIIEKRLEEIKYLSDVWNYETYDKFDIDDLGAEKDFDVSLMEYKRLNLFPTVEKFTFLAGTDMYYWSGVIMRNSCRRNDFKGGVRQCGNLECGKWEQTPREFSKCKRCKRTKYCSRECQMRAWHCHKNWCVLSNSSTSTNNADSANTVYEGQHDRTINMETATSDSEGITSNANDLSQHVSASDQETQYSEL
ncbi:hypothetical protein METBIDRAFT_76883 [Metschnikowia bicuspidata var. bicuspidata NRRL YB-4993]|uniref:MYND-type domain-containing protein n=1 Tax=Metschnikowia bicuspidata var. bicuspidata NRRL YB-4993 TaxID=869754 RepID=A0A1A0HIY8_9ASCO|nr:hypothetical protein METBIDRAFT_76883 [Metschnikowia bicuspidata var. bicuspidata NRRL YB-4993]OBA23966.1 hypothetical protein METBIDRAFT_76883 [Metschnikowia bicuspidata var. bicuspidata NRRL YB-4993]